MTPSHANRTPFPLMIAQLTGTQKQMGAQHGAMTRAVGGWEATLDYYPRMAEILIAGTSPLSRLAVRPIIEYSTSRLERARPHELRARTRAYLVLREVFSFPSALCLSLVKLRGCGGISVN